MAREHDTLSINGALLDMVNGFPGRRAAIAAMLGVDDTHLKNQLYQQKGMSVPTERALLIQEFTGRTDFAAAVAHQSGGVFVKLPADDLTDGDINEMFVECTRALGDLVREFQAATADGVVDKRELRRMEAVKSELCATAASVIQMTEKVFCKKVGNHVE